MKNIHSMPTKLNKYLKTSLSSFYYVLSANVTTIVNANTIHYAIEHFISFFMHRIGAIKRYAIIYH
jgi:hypothetical protein